MKTKKFYQKHLPVLFYYPSELVLRQYKTMSIFLIFGVFQLLFIYKVLNVIKAGFHRSRLMSIVLGQGQTTPWGQFFPQNIDLLLIW